MTNRSSTSNSDAVVVSDFGRLPRTVPWSVTDRPDVRAWARRGAQTFPAGFVWAVPMIVSIHLVFANVLYPDPIAVPELRRRLIALTTLAKPTIVVAGDSRGMFGVDPRVLTRALGRSQLDGINIATSSGDSSIALAAFREFRSRFAPAPVVILSLSSFSTGRRGDLDRRNAQYYWSADWHTRLDNLSAFGIVMSEFSSERMLGRCVSESLRQAGKPADTRRRGFFSGSEDHSSANIGYADTFKVMIRTGWLDINPRETALWHQLRRDINAFRSLGATVLILDTPMHPTLRARLSGAPHGSDYDVYESTLSEVCRELDVPLLRYEAHELGETPKGLFCDGLHLTPPGAEALSELIAQDLKRMMASGAIKSCDLLQSQDYQVRAGTD